MQSALRQVFTIGEPQILTLSTKGPDGEPRWFESHVGPVRGGDAIVGAVVISRDITDKRLVESLLVASERMASMGTLAAGVAHEINNPLAAVVGNLDIATEDLTELSKHADVPSDLLAQLADARDAADRVRAIVRDLKIFARSDDARSGPVDLRRVLESTLRMAWNEIRHRARLTKLYGDVPLVDANEGRLGQVFLNLILNAAQSIAEGQTDANEIRISTRLDATGDVVVEIADTGSGMPPEVKAHLFTPFFTTKPAGEGTGLGLSICQRIVTRLKGRIEVDSELGKGTTFRVHLPPSRSDAVVDVPRPTTSTGRRGRILSIDDEPMIGRIVSRTLSAHDVVTSTSSRDALARLSAGERFDVILCDLMMPEVTGMEFLELLGRIDPSQIERVIFVTGGAFTAAARQFLDGVQNLRIEKPFDAQQLRTLVNDRIRNQE